MSGEHGLDVSGMLPLRVLLSMHDQDHGEVPDTWHGSADSSRNTSFIANRNGIVTGMLRYTPHVREVLPLHMMSHHGWTADEVRDALEWPDAANVLPGHHDREHSVPMEEHNPVPHAHEDVSHMWPPPAPDESDPWEEFGGG